MTTSSAYRATAASRSPRSIAARYSPMTSRASTAHPNATCCAPTVKGRSQLSRPGRCGPHLLDAPGEPPQRVDFGCNGELVEMLSVVGEQTNIELLSTEIESSMQHVKRGP